MSMVTDALVLRVSDVGESDKIVTLLTADYGIIRAFANRAKKMNSKMQSATQLLCYGEFSVYTGKDCYIIDSATPKEVFFGLRNDIEKLALGQYFCALASEFIPEGEPAPDSLRVILNSLAFLQNDKRTKQFVKAVTELKLLALAGFAPDLAGCASCRENPVGDVYFAVNEGRFYCGKCRSGGRKITPGVLTAMRFVVGNPINRIYSFALTPADEKMFSELCEDFLLIQTKKSFNALDFYKSVKAEE